MEVGVNKLGNINGFTGGGFAGCVFDKDALCPTMNTMGGGNRQPMIIEETVIAAMRGRNPENPSDRTARIHTEQRLEINKDGICNTLTTVQKDNLVVEPKTTRGSDIVSTIRSSYYKNGERNIAENCKNGMGYEGVIQNYRIRKLTPRECWRLMGYSDSDFDKAQAVNSNTQLYRQAGNAIVKQVLMAIFKQMIND